MKIKGCNMKQVSGSTESQFSGHPVLPMTGWPHCDCAPGTQAGAGAALLRCNIGINDHHGAPMTRQVPNSSPGRVTNNGPEIESKGDFWFCFHQELKEWLCFCQSIYQTDGVSKYLFLREKVSATALQRTCCRYLDDKPPIINISKLPIV